MPTMCTIEFAPALQRHVACPAQIAAAATLQQAFDAVFAKVPALRGYVVDDQGAVRKHVAVFVNGELVHDRRNLTRPLAASDQVYVAQALSGG